MHHRVDAEGPHELADQAVAEVGADEVGAVEVVGGLANVDADDLLDHGVRLEPLGELVAPEAADPGDEDPLAAHGADGTSGLSRPRPEFGVSARAVSCNQHVAPICGALR